MRYKMLKYNSEVFSYDNVTSQVYGPHRIYIMTCNIILQFATYQAIVTTDGVRTYLMYVYPSGPEFTYLRRFNYFRNIYMGYNAQDGEPNSQFSVYLSTTSEIVGLHEEPSNTGRHYRIK